MYVGSCFKLNILYFCLVLTEVGLTLKASVKLPNIKIHKLAFSSSRRLEVGKLTGAMSHIAFFTAIKDLCVRLFQSYFRGREFLRSTKFHINTNTVLGRFYNTFI